MIGVDSILFDQAVPEIIYFNHDVGPVEATLILILLATLALIALATPSQF